MKRTAALAVIVTWSLVTGVAWAEGEPSPEDRATAEALFNSAKELQVQGKTAEACAKYVESQRLDPKVGTLLNAATCHEDEGKTASAWVEFSEGARLASRLKQAEREKFARKKAEDLEARLSKLVLSLAGPPVQGVEIRIDGRLLGAAALATEMPLDPGDHEIIVSARGKKPFVTRQTMEAGPIVQKLVVPELEDIPREPRPRATPRTTAQPDDGTPREPRAPVLSYAIGALGVVGLGMGTFFGIRAVSRKDEADQGCAGRFCTADGLRANDQARTAATVSTWSFVAGGAALLGAAVLYVTVESRTGAVTTTLAAGGSGAEIRGSF